MWQDLWAALALVLVLEGMFPFLRPEMWRRVMERFSSQTDNAVRLIGFMSMMMGLLLLYVIRQV